MGQNSNSIASIKLHSRGWKTRLKMVKKRKRESENLTRQKKNKKKKDSNGQGGENSTNILYCLLIRKWDKLQILRLRINKLRGCS